jgi:hypothetical protein
LATVGLVEVEVRLVNPEQSNNLLQLRKDLEVDTFDATRRHRTELSDESVEYERLVLVCGVQGQDTLAEPQEVILPLNRTAGQDLRLHAKQRDGS